MFEEEPDHPNKDVIVPFQEYSTISKKLKPKEKPDEDVNKVTRSCQNFMETNFSKSIERGSEKHHKIHIAYDRANTQINVRYGETQIEMLPSVHADEMESGCMRDGSPIEETKYPKPRSKKAN